MGDDDGIVNQDTFGKTPDRFGSDLYADSSPEPLAGRIGGSLAATGSDNFGMSGTMKTSLFG